jgi:hypothetical protein
MPAAIHEATNARFSGEVECILWGRDKAASGPAAELTASSNHDEDIDEFTAQLCTRIGMIMEDASVSALSIGRMQGKTVAAAMAQLSVAATRISALLSAVQALAE